VSLGFPLGDPKEARVYPLTRTVPGINESGGSRHKGIDVKKVVAEVPTEKSF
jgi:hypothetical protein